MVDVTRRAGVSELRGQLDLYNGPFKERRSSTVNELQKIAILTKRAFVRIHASLATATLFVLLYSVDFYGCHG